MILTVFYEQLSSNSIGNIFIMKYNIVRTIFLLEVVDTITIKPPNLN